MIRSEKSMVQREVRAWHAKGKIMVGECPYGTESPCDDITESYVWILNLGLQLPESPITARV